MDVEKGIIRSPYTKTPYNETKNQSLSDFLFSQLRTGLHSSGDKPFIVDVTAETSVKFCELENQSLRVASALSKRGFKKNDILYFVTYEMAQMYVVQLAVWRLGGATRGCYQAESQEEYVRQLQETRSKFVLVDAETAPVLKDAAALIKWDLQFVSVGNVNVPGTTSFYELLSDDGTAMPEKVDIIPKESVVVIPNTSGSTGVPKGVLHTHSTGIASVKTIEDHFPNTSLMESMITYGIGNFTYCLHAICSGLTIYHIGKFKRENYFDILMKYKPHHIIMYPYVASWFARCTNELALINKANFLDTIWIGGWVLDFTTADLIEKELPRTDIRQLYGMTEVTFLSMTDPPSEGKKQKLFSVENEGQVSVTSGKLLPYAEMKIVDISSGKAMEPMGIGEIVIKSPCVTIGYMVPGKEPNRVDFDADGWFHSGDLGFYDKEGNIYIRERLKFMFKYFMNYVSPSDIESVLHEHPSVQSAGVVGIPNEESDSLARAFVVLRPGKNVTSNELQNFVAQRLPKFKHLHGGVRFINMLPVGKAGKLDRSALKKLALQMH